MSAVVDTDVYSLGVLLYELNADGTCCFGMAPRGSNPIQMVDPELTSKTVASWRAPAAVDDREGTSFRSPTTIPVLIGLKDRKYFDVLHRDLTAYFPVPEHAEVEDHFRDPKPYWPRWLNRFREKKPASFYRKELNEQIARRLTMNDMAGSDLATIIETIKQQAEKAHQY